MLHNTPTPANPLLTPSSSCSQFCSIPFSLPSSIHCVLLIHYPPSPTPCLTLCSRLRALSRFPADSQITIRALKSEDKNPLMTGIHCFSIELPKRIPTSVQFLFWLSLRRFVYFPLFYWSPLFILVFIFFLIFFIPSLGMLMGFEFRNEGKLSFHEEFGFFLLSF